jgi:hypothetical protein
MTDTRTIEALQQAVRGLDDQTLLVWADACEDLGDQEGADALRALPAMRAYICGVWQDSIPPVENRPLVVLFRNGKVGVADQSREYIPNPVWSAVAVLLARWNEFNAAVEWLARHLDLTLVSAMGGGGSVIGCNYSLSRDHLRPVDFRVGDCILRTPRK